MKIIEWEAWFVPEPVLISQKKEHNITLPETEACFLGFAIRNIAAVPMCNESNVRWKESYVTYLKHYRETLHDRLRNTTKKPGSISGWPSWKS